MVKIEINLRGRVLVTTVDMETYEQIVLDLNVERRHISFKDYLGRVCGFNTDHYETYVMTIEEDEGTNGV